MHLRSGAGEAKLVRCSYGAVFDVVVDLRRTRRRTATGPSSNCPARPGDGVHPGGLRARIPGADRPADTSYRIDRPHDPAEDVTIAFDDPELDIPWPLPVTLMSDRDGRRRASPSSERR
jgi:dTDP-4-dehydrorhamnose 3,5-epimerase